MCASLLSDTVPTISATDARMSPAALGPRDDAEVLLPTLPGVRPRDGSEAFAPTGFKHRFDWEAARALPDRPLTPPPPSGETPARPRQPQT